VAEGPSSSITDGLEASHRLGPPSRQLAELPVAAEPPTPRGSNAAPSAAPGAGKGPFCEGG